MSNKTNESAEEIAALCKKALRGRVTIKLLYLSIDLKRRGYFPRLAGEFVTNGPAPDGYATEAEARAAATAFRESCRAWLKEHGYDR